MKYLLFLLAAATSLFSALVPASAQSVLYAATGSAGTAGSLYTINPTTGAILSSVPITNAAGGGALGITGLAFSPSTNVLYGVTVNKVVTGGNSVAGSLVVINPTTGVATVIGSLVTPVSDIAFRANGVLYGFQSQNPFSLATINLSTGVGTKVANSGLTTSVGGGLAFNSAGTLYVSASGADGTLDTFNPTTGLRTGSVTLTGAPFVSPGSFNSMAFDSNGVLYAADNNGLGTAPVDVELVRVNTSTGVVTDLFSLPDNTDAIAFRLTAVPEPSSLSLLILPAIAMGVYAVYRRLARV